MTAVERFPIAVLASGSGTNLQAILDGVHGRDGVEVALVAASRPGIGALDRAQAAGVPGEVFPASDHPSREARDSALAGRLEDLGVRLVVLAGWMELLSASFLRRFPRGVINVHPSLLPAFPGLKAVEQAVEYGVRLFGVTVHFVDDGVDTGPVVSSARSRSRSPATRTRCSPTCTRSSTSCSPRRSA